MLVLVVLVVVMAIELVQVCGKLRSAKREQAEIAAQVQQLQQENDALEADLARAGDTEFIMELARTQLGLAESGERIFYDVND
jgi:cell division protein FtsL